MGKQKILIKLNPFHTPSAQKNVTVVLEKRQSNSCVILDIPSRQYDTEYDATKITIVKGHNLLVQQKWVEILSIFSSTLQIFHVNPYLNTP